MQFGRSYEEFEVGATYKHWPGKTVTEYDDHLFCLLTMNHHPLHLDAHYAEETTAVRHERRGRQLRLLAAARHERARRVRQGDRQPRGRVAAARRPDLPRRHALRRDDRARQVGVASRRTTAASSTSRPIGYNQDGTVVCIFRRKVMVPKRSYRDAAAASSPDGRRRRPGLSSMAARQLGLSPPPDTVGNLSIRR